MNSNLILIWDLVFLTKLWGFNKITDVKSLAWCFDKYKTEGTEWGWGWPVCTCPRRCSFLCFVAPASLSEGKGKEVQSSAAKLPRDGAGPGMWLSVVILACGGADQERQRNASLASFPGCPQKLLYPLPLYNHESFSSSHISTLTSALPSSMGTQLFWWQSQFQLTLLLALRAPNQRGGWGDWLGQTMPFSALLSSKINLWDFSSFPSLLSPLPSRLLLAWGWENTWSLAFREENLSGILQVDIFP